MRIRDQADPLFDPYDCPYPVFLVKIVTQVVEEFKANHGGNGPKYICLSRDDAKVLERNPSIATIQVDVLVREDSPIIPEGVPVKEPIRTGIGMMFDVMNRHS